MASTLVITFLVFIVLISITANIFLIFKSEDYSKSNKLEQSSSHSTDSQKFHDSSLPTQSHVYRNTPESINVVDNHNHVISTAIPKVLPHKNHIPKLDKSAAFNVLMDDYIKLHSDILSKKLPPRYIVYHPNSQLGNRLRGIMSAFLFGLLTRRALLVVFSTSPYEHIQFSDLFISPGFHYIINSEDLSSITNGLSRTVLTVESTINIPTINQLLCYNLNEIYIDQVISVSGNFYWSTFLEKNPFYETFFRTYFYDINKIGQQICHFLFQPIPELIKLKNDFLIANNIDINDDNSLLTQLTTSSNNNNNNNNNMNNNPNILLPSSKRKYLVTFQIRNDNFDPLPQISDNEWTAYINCSLVNLPSYLHVHSKSNKKNKDKDKDRVKEGDEDKEGDDNVVWFIATDSAKSREIAKKMFIDRKIIFYNEQSFIRGGLKEGLQQALVDILIAASGHIIYLSPWSSYGRMIALYNINSPIYIVTDHKSPPKDVHIQYSPRQFIPYCYRLLSREECPWLESHRSFSQVIQSAQCYRPNMQLDMC